MHFWDGDRRRNDRGYIELRCECGWTGSAVANEDPHDDHDPLDDVWEEHVRPLVEPGPGRVLTWRDDTGRHHLAGDALHNGEPIDVLMPDGTWWEGRYETRLRDGLVVPLFFSVLGGPAVDNDVVSYRPGVSFEIPARAVLRHAAERP